MSQPLDLSITFTPPPDGSASEVIASVALRYELLDLSYAGTLLADPLTPQEREDLRWYLEEYPKWPYAGFLERGKRVEQLLPMIGKRLYRAVFGSPEARRIIQEWRKHPAQEQQIRIISAVPKVLSLPWELLHTGRGFLALNTRQPISIVRCLPQIISMPHRIPFTPPLRILLVTARPKGTGFVDPRSIARELVDELQGQMEAGAIALEFLRPATFEGLCVRLRDRKHPIHILHFDGHGSFEEGSKGQGNLAFENEQGYLHLVKGSELALLLQASRVPLVVLTACQSAMGADDDALSSVAAQLIQQGVDAVVAMSTSVLVASATRYTEAFYRVLAGGNSVPLAHEKAQQQLQRDPQRHLLQRRLDEEGQPVQVRDWWLPHFYQQRPVTFQLPLSEKRTRKRRLASATPLQHLNAEMPPSPRYGFTGRARELQEIERWLIQGKLVVMAGFGGMGKTALAREAADWLTRTGMYHSACFVSFEHGGDASTLLSALGQFLGTYDGQYDPQDHVAALAKLAPALKQHPTLVIADNLESLLPAGEAPLPLEERQTLWKTLLALSKFKAGVLLTCRDLSVGDERLAEGKAVAHLPLRGLHPEDAYLLASNLLNDLQIDRARAPYADLCDLLKQLDYHPLAIQVVLPALRSRSLETIRRQFATLLPQFADDAETERNRSLLASLQYSLNQLSKEQRALLPRLALFEGGAHEENLLAITEIPESEWASLRPALEQAALLTPEQVSGIVFPFLHFHPVLAPFLRSQPGADDPALCKIYAARYSWLANSLDIEDNRHPQAVRALVLHELPNLRHALNLLLEQGEREAATDLADSIVGFLKIFGRLRECDDVRKCVVPDTITGKALTHVEFRHQCGLGEDEINRDNIQAAYSRFTALLAHVEALPEGMPLGVGSYEHCVTLQWLARCLEADGQPAAAEVRLRKALSIIDLLLNQEPKNQTSMKYQSSLLTDLGTTLRTQGRYSEARKTHEIALEIDRQLGDLPGQAVTLGKLGTVALKQRHYEEAKTQFTLALNLENVLGEPGAMAGTWHQLGRVAQEQQEWDEAERCYRESLALRELQGNLAGAANTCNDLGIATQIAGRSTEAEGWYRRALKLDEQVRPSSLQHARNLSNLAYLLVNEVGAGRAPQERLVEARSYAERALTIKEPLDPSVEIWKELGILAIIADMEEQADAARAYRRRERETYAAFAGNRYHIDQQEGKAFAAIAWAARGNNQARAVVEASLPTLQEVGWPIAVIQRILAGERDWHTLAEELGDREALLILRILETLAQPVAEDQEQPYNPIEELIAAAAAAATGQTQAREVVEEALPALEAAGWHIAASIRCILAGVRELPALVAGLDEEETLIIGRILDLLTQLSAEDEDDLPALVAGFDEQDTLIRRILETLAQPAAEDNEAEEVGDDNGLETFAAAVVAAAGGHPEAQTTVEEALPQLEADGWHITSAIQRIWAGERDTAALVEGLDMQDTQLIQHILDRLVTQPATTEAHHQQAER